MVEEQAEAFRAVGDRIRTLNHVQKAEKGRAMVKGKTDESK